MPDIGTGGGMKLSVGIGLNLTGFEALTQITKELEVLQQMALKTEQSFRQMGAALRQTMNMGTAEMGRAAERMERASRSPGTMPNVMAGTQQRINETTGVNQEFRSAAESAAVFSKALDGSSASERLRDRQSPVLGTKEERFAAKYENTDFDLRARQQARALRDSERAIRDETSARDRAWRGFTGGIAATLGLSATLGVIEVAKKFMEAGAKMDDRRASLRLQGFTPSEVRQTSDMALHANAPGLDLAEKTQLAQQIGTTVGRENVTPDSLRGIGTVARALSLIAGGELDKNIDYVVQTAQSLGHLTDATGKLNAGNLTQNAVALEHMIAAAGGRVSPEKANEFFGMTRTGMQGLDVAGSIPLQATLTMLMESKGVSGKNVNQALRFLEGGNLSAKEMGMLNDAHMLRLGPGGVLPAVNPLSGKSVLSTPQILAMPNTSDPTDFFRVWAKRAQTEHPNIPLQNLINQTFPTDVARVVSTIVSPTGLEEQKKNIETIGRQPKDIEQMQEATLTFNQSLKDVGAAFSEFAQVVSPGLMHDAAAILETIAHGLHFLSISLNAIAPVLPILTRLAEILALLAGLRFAGGLLGMRVARAAAGAGAGAGGAVEGVAAGALMGRAMAGGAARTGMMAQMLDPEFAIGGALAATKAGAMKIAGRGLTAMIVSSIADSVVDSFTTEGSDTNSLIKEVIEGSSLGATVAGWPGAIFGAIVDPLLRGAAHGLKKAADTTEQYQKEHLSETYVDPFSGTAVPGLTNADVQHVPLGNTSTTSHMKSERDFQNSKPTGQRPTGPRRMSVTHSPNSMLPSTGPVKQTDFNSPLARGLAEQRQKQEQRTQGQEQSLSRYITPVTPAKLISPTGGINTPSIGATPVIPMGGSQPARSETLPSLKVSTIETNMLIVRGGGQPQVGTNATEGINSTQSSAGTSTPGLPKSSNTTSATMIAGQPIIPGRPLSPDQMAAIEFSGKMGNTYPPEIMAQYNQQKGIGQNANAPSALQSVAPGEPVAGLGSMAGAPQTGVTPGIPTHGGGTSVGGLSGAKPANAGDRMAGHHTGGMPAGLGGSTTAPAFTSAQQKDASTASVKFWMSKGLTKNQAAGMAAQEIKESGGNPRAVGDGGLAHGLYQHHPDRIAAIKAGTGIDMLTADANQQREGAYWEMMHTEKGAWQGLKASSTPQEAGAAGSMLFERPKDRMGEAISRGALASRIAMDVPNIQGPQISPEQADVPSSQMTVHVHSQHMLDGDLMAENMATHFIGAATASSSATGYDSKQHPLAPGVSVPRW